MLIGFDVGDFIEEKDSDTGNTFYYRIVGAFQALKSFVGNWDGRLVNIQNRGKKYKSFCDLVIYIWAFLSKLESILLLL